MPTIAAAIDARVHAEPIQAPLMIDVDLTLQRWFAGNLDARAGRDTRPLLWLRAAAGGAAATPVAMPGRWLAVPLLFAKLLLGWCRLTRDRAKIFLDLLRRFRGIEIAD